MGIDGAFVESGELRYGHVVAVDIERFSKLTARDQRAAQMLLARALTRAAAAAGLAREGWYRQPTGDGELAVLPADTDVALVVANFTDHLVRALRRLRADTRAHPKLRLRMAIHHGPLAGGLFGPVGPALVVTCRLLDSRPARAALAGNPDCDLVLIVSRQLYQDVVVSGFRGLVSDRFQPMRTTVKGTTYAGYFCLGSPK
ncbi:MAG TPA: hypothetical protein VGR06_41940 [Actinophytocola sp.]|jgi:class 3 adenylate cyclase|uniref:hypothetical protein n=1 Tax=Actinophytocola sp. TaxID=1872138 RepID=UPI002E06D0E8|nr:hypothetical protein [Actinophytocola sp.]